MSDLFCVVIGGAYVGACMAFVYYTVDHIARKIKQKKEGAQKNAEEKD